jgi:hypothetical protein
MDLRLKLPGWRLCLAGRFPGRTGCSVPRPDGPAARTDGSVSRTGCSGKPMGFPSGRPDRAGAGLEPTDGIAVRLPVPAVRSP